MTTTAQITNKLTPQEVRDLPVGSLIKVTSWGVEYTILRGERDGIKRLGTYQVRGGLDWVAISTWGHSFVLLHGENA